MVIFQIKLTFFYKSNLMLIFSKSWNFLKFLISLFFQLTSPILENRSMVLNPIWTNIYNLAKINWCCLIIYWQNRDSMYRLSVLKLYFCKVHLCKGQRNSKWFFQADVPSKKRMNKFYFTTCQLRFRSFFGRKCRHQKDISKLTDL